MESSRRICHSHERLSGHGLNGTVADTKDATPVAVTVSVPVEDAVPDTKKVEARKDATPVTVAVPVDATVPDAKKDAKAHNKDATTAVIVVDAGTGRELATTKDVTVLVDTVTTKDEFKYMPELIESEMEPDTDDEEEWTIVKRKSKKKAGRVKHGSSTAGRVSKGAKSLGAVTGFHGKIDPGGCRPQYKF
jgi:hypothetical protein